MWMRVLARRAVLAPAQERAGKSCGLCIGETARDLIARHALRQEELRQIAANLIDAEPAMDAAKTYERVLAELTMLTPSFSLRGGTREILRGIIARGLGLR